MTNKTVTAQDFLTEDEIRQIPILKTAKLIKERIIAPNIDRINKSLGQKNDPMYLAYALEYVFSQASRR